MRQSHRAHLSMLLATILVATSFPVGAAITHGLDSLVLTFMRFTLAAVLFAPFIALRYGLALPRLRDLARYGALSACLVVFFWSMFTALRHTSALNTATIFSLTPVLTAAVSAVLLKEKLSASARIALPTGMIGVIWVIFRGDPASLISFKLGFGDGIFLAGTLAMSLYSPLVKHLHRGDPEDRRGVRVALTDQGLELVDRAIETRFEEALDAVSQLPPEDRVALGDLLRALTASLPPTPRQEQST